MTALLAFDTATERMVIALSVGGRLREHTAAGGAKASASLIPSILSLLGQAGITLDDLDAIAFGRGPGAFTGLRTACSVAQGLALGAGKTVIPIDSLLLVAEDVRDGAESIRVWVAIDARMNQIYAAEYEFGSDEWRVRTAPLLTDCERLSARWAVEPAQVVAGDALRVFGPRLDTGAARLGPEARPRPKALAGLAERAWRQGAAVDPALALPLYVRDKVAETTSERAAASRT